MNGVRTAVAALLAAGVLAADAGAFGSGDDRGAAGFRGLLLLPNTRAAGIGGAATALPGNANALATSNPASLGAIATSTASLSATSYVLDIVPASGVVALPTRIGVIGFSAGGTSYGDFERIDNFAVDGGSFGASDLALHAGWARRWKNGLAIGVSAGWLRSTIDAWSANALVFNVGALWQTNHDATSIGVAATNVGGALDSYAGIGGGVKDAVPTALHLGAMHRPAHFPVPLAILADMELPRDDDAKLSIGAEFTPVGPLALRVGYSGLVRYASTSITGAQNGIVLDDREAGGFGGIGLRFGLGIDWRRFGLDYAYVPGGPFGSIHTVTTRVAW